MLPVPHNFKPLVKDHCTMCGTPMFVKEVLEKLFSAWVIKIKCPECGIEWKKTILA